MAEKKRVRHDAGFMREEDFPVPEGLPAGGAETQAADEAWLYAEIAQIVRRKPPSAEGPSKAAYGMYLLYAADRKAYLAWREKYAAGLKAGKGEDVKGVREENERLRVENEGLKAQMALASDLGQKTAEELTELLLKELGEDAVLFQGPQAKPEAAGGAVAGGQA